MSGVKTARKIIYSAPSAGQHEVDAAAAALRTFEPPDPVDHRQLGAVASGVLRRGRLDPMLAIAAPDDEARLGGRRVAERRQRARFGFHDGSTSVAAGSASRAPARPHVHGR